MTFDMEGNADAAIARRDQGCGEVPIPKIVGRPDDFPAARNRIDPFAEQRAQEAWRPIGAAEMQSGRNRIRHAAPDNRTYGGGHPAAGTTSGTLRSSSEA